MLSEPEFIGAFLVAMFFGVLFGRFMLFTFGHYANYPIRTQKIIRHATAIIFFTMCIVILLFGILIFGIYMYVISERREFLIMNWLVFGYGRPVCGGLVAGLLTSGAMQLAILMATEGTSALATGLVATGPVAAVFVLYVISVPGALRTLGLTGVKAGGLELEFAIAPKLPNTSSNVSLPRDGGRDDESSQLSQLLDLTGEDNPSFPSFFQRETWYIGWYINGVEHIHVGPESSIRDVQGWIGQNSKWSPAIKAILRQKSLLERLHPLISCEALVNSKIVLDPQQMERQNDSIIGALVALDLGLEHLAHDLRRINLTQKVQNDRNAPKIIRVHDLHRISLPWQKNDSNTPKIIYDDWNYVRKLADNIEKQVNDELGRLRNLLPEYILFGKSDSCGKSFSIPPDLVDEAQPLAASYAWTPPYIAIFAANAYAAGHSYQAALKVLDNWLARHPRTSNTDPTSYSLLWLHDQAELQFALIQMKAVPSITMNSADQRALKIVRKHLAEDWHVSLAEAHSCATADAPVKQGSDGWVKTQLASAYANLAGAWPVFAVTGHIQRVRAGASR